MGKVRQIGLEDSKVRVDFFVNGETVIRTDSVAEIRQTNLLGGQFLGLTFGSADAKELPPDSAVPSIEKTDIDQLIRITSYNVCYTKLLRMVIAR